MDTPDIRIFITMRISISRRVASSSSRGKRMPVDLTVADGAPTVQRFCPVDAMRAFGLEQDVVIPR